MRYSRWWYGTACRPYDPTMFLSDSARVSRLQPGVKRWARLPHSVFGTVGRTLAPDRDAAHPGLAGAAALVAPSDSLGHVATGLSPGALTRSRRPTGAPAPSPRIRAPAGPKRPGADRRRRLQCSIPSRSTQIGPNHPQLRRVRQRGTPTTVLQTVLRMGLRTGLRTGLRRWQPIRLPKRRRRRVGHAGEPPLAQPGLHRPMIRLNRPVRWRPRTSPLSPLPALRSRRYDPTGGRLAGEPERSPNPRWKSR
jgi:hypothetical protein